MPSVKLIEELIGDKDARAAETPEFPRDKVQRIMKNFEEEIMLLLVAGREGTCASITAFKISEARRIALNDIAAEWGGVE